MTGTSSHHSRFRIRTVGRQDADILLEWRNDPATRAAAITQGIVTSEEHRTWFAGKLSDPGCVMYIGELNGVPVGQIRFDIEGDAAVITIATAPEWRGKGLGSQLLREACQAVAVRELVAYVRPENEPSVRLFSRNGFREVGVEHRGNTELSKMVRAGIRIEARSGDTPGVNSQESHR